MKRKTLFFGFFFLQSITLKSQNFITIWQFEDAATELNFYAVTDVGPVNYSWTASPSGNSGSGSFVQTTPDVLVTLSGMNIPANNNVTINMEPTNLRRFYNFDDFGNTNPDAYKLIAVNQWGSVPWSSMYGAFANTPINSFPGAAPNLVNVSNMSHMFAGATSFNQPLSNWNVSNVTDMSAMFFEATSFNQPLNNWNVSNVTNMSSMFYYATNFNQSLDNWNVSNVTNMDNMFFDADSFNQPLNNWDVSNVTTMWALFGFANNFNQPLNNWDVSNVTQMAYMFVWAASFNQPLNNWQLKPGVSIYEFLNSSGMDCNNYSASLAGWAANPNTPSNLIIGVQGRQYGTNVVTQRTFLDVNKNWTFNGDTPSSSICSFILPITLLSFEVSNTGMKNHLNWTTTSEINNHFFDIEYSSDGKEFKSIGAILGSGTTTETKNYSFIHDRPSAGINYYRIKQVDFDGQYSYSDVASVRIDHDSAFQNFTISPNPVVSGFPFSLQGVEVDSDIKLYTLQGQEVQIERVSGGAEFIIDVPTGIYYINDNQHSRFSKIVVIK